MSVETKTVEPSLEQLAQRLEQNVKIRATPQLPVDLIGVIAEHLIGQYAFETVANLNLASKAIRRETLPILYETLLLEHCKGLEYYRSGGAFSEGLKHTKYLFISQQDPRNEEVEKPMADIVMTISIDTALRTHSANSCFVYVHRSISSAIAIQILETPLRHPSRNHTVCKILEAEMNGRLPPPILMNAGWPEVQTPVWMCDKEEKKPAVRPIEGIKELVLTQGARIHSKYPIRNRHPISLNGTIVGREPRSKTDPFTTLNDDDLGITAVELMKLVCTDCHEERARAENRIRGDYNFKTIMPYKAICSYTRYYSPWHVQLLVPTVAELRAFVKQLAKEARSCPGILRNRIRIDLTRPTSTESEIREILTMFMEIYREHITKMDQVFQWACDGSPIMLHMDALAFGNLVPPAPGPSPNLTKAMCIIQLKSGPGGSAVFRGGYNATPASANR